VCEKVQNRAIIALFQRVFDKKTQFFAKFSGFGWSQRTTLNRSLSGTTRRGQTSPVAFGAQDVSDVERRSYHPNVGATI
jgi:hypothetical protein